jgi:hypothetical protein
MALKPGTPCVVVSTGGTPVSEAPADNGTVLTPASNGFGIPVRIITPTANPAMAGMSVTFVSEAGALLPGGA